jgi:hypothetical protein
MALFFFNNFSVLWAIEAAKGKHTALLKALMSQV